MTRKDARTRWLPPTAIRASLVVMAMVGVVAVALALTSSETDPIEVIVADWRALLGPAALYAVGLVLYSWSWARLFVDSDDRRLLALGFLVSQPAKYLPGGFAQPLGQVGLAAQTTRSPGQVLVRFPVHVLLNVVATLTLASYLPLTPILPGWTVWILPVVPLAWLSLSRRWMTSLLAIFGRRLKRFRLNGEVPPQSLINTAFLLALFAHALMALSFATLAAPVLVDWTLPQLVAAYAAAWVVGYLIVLAPAGLGVREATLVFLFAGSLPAIGVVRIAATHRVLIVIVEVVVTVMALVVARSRWTTASDAD